MKFNLLIQIELTNPSSDHLNFLPMLFNSLINRRFQMRNIVHFNIMICKQMIFEPKKRRRYFRSFGKKNYK